MSKLIRPVRPLRAAAMAAMVLVMASPTVPVFAQDTQAEARLRKLEAEIRALQRKVFPGPEGKFFEAEIKPADPAAASTAGQPATSAVTDILTRMDSLELQIARLTGQVEQNSNRLAQLEARTGGSAADTAAPAVAATTSAVISAATSAPAPTPTPAPQANLNAMSGGASASKPIVEASPPAKRLEAVQAIVKPQTDDPGDDEYSYGFRLWDAKFYPEAQQQLKLFIDKYPKHSRISWGRNLLGRAYLDDGNPREAAKWFLQNYNADKNGARAPDSLLYLAAAMKEVKDTKRACIALAEFSETHPAEAAGRLRSLYDSTRNGLTCS